LIRLSLLPTAHPLTFQRKWVRSSRSFYRPFNLAMGRSLSFGSTACDIVALFRLAFAGAPRRRRLARPHTVTRWSIMQKVRRHSLSRRTIELRPLCRYTVSGTFNSPSRGSFHLSLALLSTIGRDGVLSLGEWAPQLHTDFHGFRATLEHQHNGGQVLLSTGLSPCIV
jgi:hypothetical protein